MPSIEPDIEPTVEQPPLRRDPSWQQVLIAYRWPIVLLLMAFLALWLLHQTLQTITATGDKLSELPGRLVTSDITERFLASIPHSEVTGTLELAKAEVVETFTRSDELRILGDWVSLGTTVSEIRVPVTYRYHLRLEDPWQLEIVGETCVVHAPAIRPTQPPAIHTDRMEKRLEESWLRFDGEEQLAELERSLTPKLIAQARDELHLKLVREDSRLAVEAFVRGWLLNQDEGRADHVRFVKVIFPSELEKPNSKTRKPAPERGP